MTADLASPDRFFQQLAGVRLRAIAAAFVSIAAFGFGTWSLAGNQWTRAALVVCGLGILAAAAVTLFRPARANPAVVAGLALSVPVLHHLDFCGPMVGIVCILLCLYAVNAPPRWVIAATLVSALPQLVGSALVLHGSLPNGILYWHFPVDGLNVSSAMFELGSTAVLFVLGPALGLTFRARTSAHLAELAEAGRAVAAQEALLREAQLDRDRSRGAGQPGRFSEQRLGSFTLGAILGRGGMGEVYEATHAATGARAAVKLFRSRSGEARTALRRFEREVAIAGTLRSPNIVKVLEVGGLDAGFPFIAMERLDGEDCGELLRREGRMSPGDVVDMVQAVASGLTLAKAQNIVHRDIKPSNLFRTRSGKWKILDFGAGRIAGPSGSLTGDDILGTLGYLAPEQLVGDGEVTHRSDQHSLAIVVYRALTGRPAFVERDPAEAIAEISSALPPRPSTLAAISPAVDDVLLVALAKEPSARFADSAEFAQALQAAIRGEQSDELRARARALSRVLGWCEVAPAHGSASGDTQAQSATSSAPDPVDIALRRTARGFRRPKVARVTLVAPAAQILDAMCVSRAPWLMAAIAGMFAWATAQVWFSPNYVPVAIGAVGVVAHVVVGAHVVALLWLARAQSSEAIAWLRRLAVTAFFASTSLIYLYSPYGYTSGFLAIALLFYGLSSPARLHALAAALVMGSHAAIHLAVTFGWLPTPAEADVGAGIAARLWNLAQGLAVYGLSAAAAATLRTRTLEALEQLSRAFRHLAEREALVQQARAELQRAAGVGQAGRYTARALGHYVLGNILGRGGMGEVYEATNALTGQAAAVKVLGKGGRGALDSFGREGLLLRSLDSPNLVRAIEVGDGEDGLPFIAMERLVGTDLAAILRRQLTLKPEEVVDLVEQVSRGLDVLHRSGLAHRDLSPRNLFRTEDGTWKIIDLGAAASSGDALVGTPSYMAPEQLKPSHMVDGRADIHALAAVAYTALTGRPPFAGRSPMSIANRVLRSNPVRASSLVCIPEAVDGVLAVAMAKRAADRFEVVASFASAFREAMRGRVDEAVSGRALRVRRPTLREPSSQLGARAAQPIRRPPIGWSPTDTLSLGLAPPRH